MQLPASRRAQTSALRTLQGSLWALQRSAEAGLLEEYRAKLAAAHRCFRPEQLAAALARIMQERDDALRALRAKHRSERRQASVRAAGSTLRARRPPRRLTTLQLARLTAT